MSQEARSEFWKGLKPITNSVKPDAQPEVYLSQVATDDDRAFFIVKGPLIWLDENGETVGYFDVHDYIELCRNHYEKVGIGADYVNSLFR
ncbi:hypothetical protein [Streptomyces sp. NBC_00076]|uniref:hypothetical protein n=1 Tax=Streptomyces sp. NBC_00076 TaxID=2975642 RepID=UPI0032469BD2